MKKHITEKQYHEETYRGTLHLILFQTSLFRLNTTTCDKRQSTFKTVLHCKWATSIVLRPCSFITSYHSIECCRSRKEAVATLNRNKHFVISRNKLNHHITVLQKSSIRSMNDVTLTCDCVTWHSNISCHVIVSIFVILILQHVTLWRTYDCRVRM